MYNTCCVVNCTSRRKDVSFHMFPKSEIGLKKWLQCINCERLRSLSFQELRKQFVCGNHFEKKFLSTTRDRVRLCPDAYPTLFTTHEISSDIPQTDAIIPDKYESVKTDHDYCKKRRHEDHTYCKTEVAEKRSKTDNIEMEVGVISPSSCGHEVIEVPLTEIEAGVISSLEIKFQHCEENLTSKESNFDKKSLNNWISFKEFKSIKEKKLTYPSENAVRYFGIITEEANKYLEKQPEQTDIIKSIKNLIKSNYLFDFINCELHKDAVSECFLALTLRLTVFNWCNVINKILKGTDVFRLENKTLPQMQLKAHNKFKTKFKNKKK